MRPWPDGPIPRNPAKSPNSDCRPRRELHRLTAEEQLSALRAAEGQRIPLPLLPTLSTGLRRGGILGLWWDGVDVAGGRLSLSPAPRNGSGTAAVRAAACLALCRGLHGRLARQSPCAILIALFSALRARSYRS